MLFRSACDGYQFQVRNQSDESTEIRLSSKQSSPLQWQVGVYYLHIDRHVGVSTGIAGRPVQTLLGVFPSFSVGDESIANAKLRIADMFSANTRKQIDSLIAKQAVDEPDMLLGADFIRAHRIYIARSQGKMYFSYNGGPIFQVVRPPEADAPPANQTPAAPHP